MFDDTETVNPSVLLRPYGKAERALGRLAHALEITPLHLTWLWRELARSAVIIAQTSGHHARVDHLRLALIGAPIDLKDNTSGLAAAKRIFLAAAPLFYIGDQTDSNDTLWPQFWSFDDGAALSDAVPPYLRTASPSADGQSRRRPWNEDRERDGLFALVKELAGVADDGHRPALINLLIDLRRHSVSGRLPALLMRIALPLALVEVELVPKAAPGLLGGRRLSLGMSRASPEAAPVSEWLALAFSELALEANQSRHRLVALERQHRAWCLVLSKESCGDTPERRRSSICSPATPVLSIGLVARHLGCSHVAAGRIIERLADLGILIEQTFRSRHKIFIAGDLAAPVRGEAPLSLSAPLPAVDVDTITATLCDLYADLDRLNERARNRTRPED